MKTPTKTVIAALALGLLTSVGGAFAADPAPAPATAYGPGNCPMAQQCGPGGMGSMMGRGSGMGMGMGGGPAMMQQQAGVDKNLTVAQVREFYDSRIKFHNNDRVKLGNVVEKDADTISVEIVTVDNSLINKFDIDRHTGWRK